MKIEPMSAEEIRWQVRRASVNADHIDNVIVLRLILAWAHAEARARATSHMVSCEEPNFTINWLNSVLEEIGWPKDENKEG